MDKSFVAAGADWGKKNEAFIAEFKSNTAVFAAFKAHAEGHKIAALLVKEDGTVRPFHEFKKEALKIDKDWNKNWLQAEYNTALRAARMAVNWKRILETKDLYPNLEYTDSRAADPRESHRKFYGIILPIEHPFWRVHTPPSDWNCQCGIKATDKPATAPPEGWEEIDNPVFANNPGITAKFVNIEATAYYKYATDKAKDEIAEQARLAQAEQTKFDIEYKRRTYKSGGYIETPVAFRQNKNEEQKNIEIFSLLAKYYGLKYKLLPVMKDMRNPDAWDESKQRYSEAKATESLSGKNAIQNSIRKASAQSSVEFPIREVVIRLQHQFPYKELMAGFKAALHEGRAADIKEAVLIYPDGSVKRYDLDKLRAFYKKAKG